MKKEVTAIRFEDYIETIPDFPKQGVSFKDISPLLGQPKVFREAVAQVCEPFESEEIDLIAGVEARGFIIAPAMALQLDLGFFLIRKPGKLPGRVVRQEYSLEYGTNTIEMQSGKIEPGMRVLIADDVLATGGTVAAAKQLIESQGGIVAGYAFLIELSFLSGRDKLGNEKIFSLIRV